MTARTSREIGPVGTAARIVTALALLYIVGGSTIASWSIDIHDAAIGLVTLPALMIGLGLVARRYAEGTIRFTGPLGIALNLAVIVALIANDVTGPGATLFYGATMLIAAWRGQAGCEGTVVSNWVLDRDDQIGSPIFAPIDEVEAHLRRRAAIADAHSLAAAAVCLGTGATIALIAILG